MCAWRISSAGVRYVSKFCFFLAGLLALFVIFCDWKERVRFHWRRGDGQEGTLFCLSYVLACLHGESVVGGFSWINDRTWSWFFSVYVWTRTLFEPRLFNFLQLLVSFLRIQQVIVPWNLNEIRQILVIIRTSSAMCEIHQRRWVKMQTPCSVNSCCGNQKIWHFCMYVHAVTDWAVMISDNCLKLTMSMLKAKSHDIYGVNLTCLIEKWKTHLLVHKLNHSWQSL